MSTLTDVLAWHRAQLGTAEVPDGSNRTPYGVAYGWDGVPWCDIYQCQGSVAVTGSTDAVCGKHAWTVDHARAFVAAGRWGTEPKVGALAFYDWSGTKSIAAIDHIEIVVAAPLPDGRIPTIGGNVSNGVRALLRSPGYIVGYGYPTWCDEPAAPAPTPAPTPAPRPTVPPFPGTIRYGDHGPAVRAFQARLAARGWRIGVDGSYGPQTRSVLTAYQREKRLTPDGIGGPITWRSLWTAPVTR